MVLEYLSALWCSAADSHLKLLYRRVLLEIRRLLIYIGTDLRLLAVELLSTV